MTTWRPLLFATAFAVCTPVADAAETADRALVLVSTPDDADAAVGATLMQTIAARLPAGTAALPDRDVMAALTARKATSASCARDEGCAAAVARQLRAQVYVAGSLEHSGKTYVLTVARGEAAVEGKPHTTFERMKRLNSLDTNVQLCMARLFPAAAPATGAEVPGAPTTTGATAESHHRIMVVAYGNADGTSIDAIPGEIAEVLAGPSAEIVPAPATRTAFAARKESLSDCQHQQTCRDDVARGLSADVVLTATLDKAGKAWVLSLTRDSPGDAQTQSTSERMKKLSSLALNVRLCVGRLFPSAAGPVADLSLDDTAMATPPAVVTASSGPLPAPAAPSGSSPASTSEAPASGSTARAPASTDRVVVIVAASETIDRKTGAALPDQIARELAVVHPSGFVPAADVQHALDARNDNARDCLDRKYCAPALASKLDATLLVTATVEHAKGSYLLTMTSGNPLQAERKSTSESMRQLSSMERNIRLCLERLFPPAGTAVPTEGGQR
jgi:hypothetical protein